MSKSRSAPAMRILQAVVSGVGLVVDEGGEGIGVPGVIVEGGTVALGARGPGPMVDGGNVDGGRVVPGGSVVGTTVSGGPVPPLTPGVGGTVAGFLA